MYKKWIGVGLLCAVLAMGIEVYLIGALWVKKDTCQVLVLNNDLKSGSLIGEKDFTKVEVAKTQVVKSALQEGEKILKQRLTRDVLAGKILTKSDFEEDRTDEKVESIVVKLDYEQSHGGSMGEGELVNILCYRQGEVKLVEDLVIRRVERDTINLGESAYYITLCGKSELLKTLVLAKREGSIHILKKTAVHN